MVHSTDRFRHLVLLISIATLMGSAGVRAETEANVITIQPKDTLSTIVAKYYPNYRRPDVAMRLILQQNPDAFMNQDLNRLIVGKKLTLPPASAVAANESAFVEKNAENASDTTADTATNTVAAPAEPTDTQPTSTAPTAEIPTTPPTEIPSPSTTPLATDTTAPLREQINLLEQEKQQQTKQIQALEEQLANLQQAVKANTQAETKAAETTQTADVPDETNLDDALDPQILLQQLESIEAANEELLAENKTLKQSLSAANTTPAPTAPPATPDDATAAATSLSPAETADANAGMEEGEDLGMDVEMLNQQLEAIEAANEELLSENKNLKQAQATTQQEQQALKTQIATLTADLDTASKDLQLVRAALANTELTRPQTGGSPWWLWLLSLFLLPLAWFFGRKSITPSTAPTPALVATAPAAPMPVSTLEEVPSAIDASHQEVDLAGLSTLAAANDDDPEAAIKLDMVRAYLDLRDPLSAQPLLKEVLAEGGQRQKQEAREILSFIS